MLAGSCETTGIINHEDYHIFIPPNAVKQFIYKCDNRFHLEYLIDLYRDYKFIPVVLISGKLSLFYFINEHGYQLLKKIEVKLPNQHGTGGSSTDRFRRIRDEKIKNYVTKLIELMKSMYISNGVFNYANLIIAGPCGIKEQLVKENLFLQAFQKMKLITTPEITSGTIHMVVQTLHGENSPESLHSFVKVIEMLNDTKKCDLLVFGETNILDAFEQNTLKEIYIHEHHQKLDAILEKKNKTQIEIVKTHEITKLFDGLVGVRYY